MWSYFIVLWVPLYTFLYFSDYLFIEFIFFLIDLNICFIKPIIVYI